MAACRACGAEIPADARFCPACGTPVAAAAPEEMLKLVTVVFADVVGSTARAESRHPEDVRATMRDFFAAMAAEIEAGGGTVEKYVGDAIMAVFGVPAAHEDDPVRAVRAARAMLARLDRWNDGRDAADRIEIRIGVNTGDVIASGAAGEALRVTGDAVNVAARLQQAAEPGTVLVGERTARAVRPFFELAGLDAPLELKGKSSPVAAWVVGAERDDAEARGVPGLSAPLVGRDDELAFLRTAFDRVAHQRRPELVTLVGDAGIGKSRLVREFVGGLDVVSKVLVGRCLPYGQSVTLAPLAEMLKAEAIVLDTDDADEAAAKIRRLVDESIEPELAGDATRTAAALAATLGVRASADPFADADPHELYRELVTAWRALFASLARGAPVVAVVEDLHWADSTMLDVLDELAERLEGPILFLCTTRPDLLRSRAGWGGGRRGFSSMPLDPLSGDDSARLVSLLLDVDAVPERLRRRILVRSEGNPFFLEEIVRHLIDDGLLVRDDGRWRARSGVDDVEIPDSVQAVILARLDLLSPEERRVAQHAAVVGRVFWDGAVAAIVGVDDLRDALTTLRRREFVVEALSSSVAGATEFVFKHVLIRDVAYESLPRRQRGPAHAETAAWIERTRGDGTADVAELLAHHYEAAFAYLHDDALRKKAREQLLSAAGSAHRRYVMEQGERFARRAVELSEAGTERVEALERLADLHYHYGDAAWRAYREALSELSEDDPAFPRIAAKAAQFGARWVGTMQELPDADEVAAIIEKALRVAPEGGRDRALLLVAKGFLFVQRTVDAERAAAATAEATAAAEQLEDADVLSAVLDLAQGEAMAAGRYGDKYRLTLRRNALIPRMTNPIEIGDSHAMAAWSSQHLGRYREADTHATACIERSRGIDAGAYLHGLTWRVSARFMLGEWDAALEDQAELERVAALDPRDLLTGYTARAYGYTALCHELRGDHGTADHYVRLVLRYFRSRQALAALRGSLHGPPVALALARRGRFDEALAVIPLVRPSGGAGLSLEAICEITAAREAWADAPRVVGLARDEAEIGEQRSLPAYADRLEGRAAAAAGDAARAAELIARSIDVFAELEAPWEEAWSRLLLAEVVLPDDPARAEREIAAALPVFERLRSVAEVDRARSVASLAAA